MVLPGAPSWVSAPQRRRQTLQHLLHTRGLPFPPASSGIDIQRTDCAVLSFNNRWLAILPEADKGYGLFTIDRLKFGEVVGEYDGFKTMQCPEHNYGLEVRHCYIDANPLLVPKYYNCIPVGWWGDGLLAYINEPSSGEIPNVVYCEDEYGWNCHVVVCSPEGITPWQPLLVCYNSGYKTKYVRSQLCFHDCGEAGCGDLAAKAQAEFTAHYDA